jgi:hypothetical protein
MYRVVESESPNLTVHRKNWNKAGVESSVVPSED